MPHPDDDLIREWKWLHWQKRWFLYIKTGDNALMKNGETLQHYNTRRFKGYTVTSLKEQT